MNTIYQSVQSSSSCFLRGKSHITIMSSTHAKHLILENKTATGVVVFGQDGKGIHSEVKKEVIVSCGVFETPKLLILSGIGPKEQLEAHKIELVVVSPNVGQNLLDHPVMPHVFKMKPGYGLDDQLSSRGPYVRHCDRILQTRPHWTCTQRPARTSRTPSHRCELESSPRLHSCKEGKWWSRSTRTSRTASL